MTINKNNLPHGAIKAVAVKAGVTYPTALRTINGKSENKKVLDALESYLMELKQKKEKIAELLK